MWSKPLLLIAVKADLLTGAQPRCVLRKGIAYSILEDEAGPWRLLSPPRKTAAPKRLTQQQPFTWVTALQVGWHLPPCKGNFHHWSLRGRRRALGYTRSCLPLVTKCLYFWKSWPQLYRYFQKDCKLHTYLSICRWSALSLSSSPPRFSPPPLFFFPLLSVHQGTNWIFLNITHLLIV